MKNFIYTYPDSRKQFIENCKIVDKDPQTDYRIRFVCDDEILFGVKRAGHSSGYWFKTNIIEKEDGLHILGELILMDYNNKKIELSKKDKLIETLFMAIFILLTWWLIFIFWLIKSIRWLSNKIVGKKYEPNRTKEEELDRLMINRLGCKKVS